MKYVAKIRYTYVDSDQVHTFTSVPIQAKTADDAERTAVDKLHLVNPDAIVVSVKVRANLKSVS